MKAMLNSPFKLDTATWDHANYFEFLNRNSDDFLLFDLAIQPKVDPLLYDQNLES